MELAKYPSFGSLKRLANPNKRKNTTKKIRNEKVAIIINTEKNTFNYNYI